MTNTLSPMELAELQVVFDELDADFAEFELDDAGGDNDAMAELDAELEGTGLAELSMGGDSFSEMFTDDFEQQFVGRWLRKKASKIISALIKAGRKARGCAHCVAKIAHAVRLFKRKKYVAAIRAAYAAYRCIRACLK
ncbi:MAG: hypothetical protein ACSHWS_05965 [Sulfitobacter sp.]